MATGPENIELASWHEEQTSVRKLLEALAQLWQTASVREHAAAPGTAQRAPITRTSVLNLVVYASSRGISERAASAIAHIAGTNPSRSVVILAEPDAATGELAASLAARCTVDEGGQRRLCFEQIDLRARGGTIEHLPGIVTQLLIHDLPSMLWWPGDPPLDKPLFTAMAGVCDTVIVDSSDFGDPQAGLATLAGFVHHGPGYCRIGDLNWNRLSDWREMVAQFFDTSTTRPLLDQIEQVQIEYAFDPGGQHHSAQALLLAGWLAARLGWELVGAETKANDGQRLRLQAAGRSISVEIDATQVHRDLPGAVTSVSITSAAEGQRTRLSVVAEDDAEHATTTVTRDGSEPISRMVRLERREESVLLAEEMESFGCEEAFQEALDAARRMTGHPPG